MEIPSGQSPGNLEDRIRQMILTGGSTPDERAIPTVRLPPSTSQYPNQAPEMKSIHHPQPSDVWPNAGPQGPALPHAQGFPPPGFAGPRPPFPVQAPKQMPPSHARHARHHQQSGPHESSKRRLPPQPHTHTQVHQYPNPGDVVRGRGGPRQQRQQHVQLDPHAFQRGGSGSSYRHQPPPHLRNLYDPDAHHVMPPLHLQHDYHIRRENYLEQIASTEIPNVEMSQDELREKESFRQTLQRLCNEVSQENLHLPECSLECFGSFQSGFANAGSDMDLAIVVRSDSAQGAVFSMMDDDLPRALERRLLQAGHGARLLTRTRVPIIKICQSPSESLLDKLRAERERWDLLPNETKYPHLHHGQDNDEEDDHDAQTAVGFAEKNETQVTKAAAAETTTSAIEHVAGVMNGAANNVHISNGPVFTDITTGTTTINEADRQNAAASRRDLPTTWTRERRRGPLDFPKDGVGVQCDINFFNPLGLHNTQMLRCYSLCDPRVRPMVLFVKSWVKLRRINSSYSGTLSSYGYVLMVLHYLVNVAQQPVLPNLQGPWRPHPACAPPGTTAEEVDGWNVDFWQSEGEIIAARESGQLTSNRESLGSLLAGFFQYFASQGGGPSFSWTRSVLSLRTQGGILTKDEKGWVKATTEEGAGKKIQHRYLFCIEDPFELSHNVARTVTHNGIVAIRDEFRRAGRILHAVGQGQQPRDGYLFFKLVEAEDFVEATAQLKLSNDEVGRAKLDGAIEHVEQGHLRSRVKPPHQRTGNSRANHAQPLAKPKVKALDLADQEAFPTLAVTSSTKKSRKQKQNAEASGEEAQAYLEEFRRKKAERQAEYTATGAAEAVLGEDD